MLLGLIREGDSQAREDLVRRYLPALLRWARGRLPRPARDLMDTDDIVQVSFLRSLDRVGAFELRWKGAFMAYLRRVLMNEIRDQMRRANRIPLKESLPEHMPELGPSPLEEAMGRQQIEVYEKGLATLTEEQQEAVMLRVEMGFTYKEVAEALGSPSPNAAHMVVARALVRLTEVMHEG